MANGYSRYSGSEFTGDFRDNTISAKKRGDFLTAGERRRLLVMTGREDDPTLPHDTRVWDGLAPSPLSVIDTLDD